MTALRHWPANTVAPSRAVLGPTPCRTCAWPVVFATDTVSALGLWWEFLRLKSGETVLARRHRCVG